VSRAWRSRIATIATAVVMSAALASCEDDGHAPAWNFERMLTQPRVDAYEATSFFADGAAMRRPPADTVARERVLDPPGLVDGRDGAGWVERIPLTVDRALLERGRGRFEVYCAACHGLVGDAKTPVADAMTLRRPTSLHDARVRDLPDGRLYAVVRDGYGMMPPYAAVLSLHDRWAVVAYVRALQLSQHAVLADLAPTTARAIAARADAASARGRGAP
jgi:mono/diheme cytochrome c family protein